MTHQSAKRPDRRRFFKQLAGGAAASAAVVSGTATSLVPGRAHATAAGNFNGAGFYRFALGSKTVTVLADGNDDFPGREVWAINVTDAEFATVQAQLLQPTDSVPFHMNTLLIEEGERKIMIDAGFGHFLGPRFGRQSLALSNLGVDPSEIDTIVITHGHADHFAGLVGEDLKLRFPNAQIIWNEGEWRYWTSDQAVSDVQASQLSQGFKDLFISTTKTVLQAAAPNVELLDVAREREIAPGVVLVPAPGHTPHSIVVMISSGSEQMLYASDTTLLVKQNAIAPEWVSAFEYDAKELVETRLRLLDQAAADGISWFGYHADFPAVGRIRKTASAYEFVESPWQW